MFSIFLMHKLLLNANQNKINKNNCRKKSHKIRTTKEKLLILLIFNNNESAFQITK